MKIYCYLTIILKRTLQINMKQIIIILTFFSFLITHGQVNENKTKQVKALKVAFITNELAMTPLEASQFWPVYNEFDRKLRNLRKQKKVFLSVQNGIQIDQLSETEALKLLSQLEQNDEQAYLIKKKFITDIQTILSPVKILKLKKAEEDFNRKLLKQYRSKK